MYPLCALLAVCSLGLQPQDMPDREVIRGSNHGHTYTVILEQRPFRRKAHRIASKKIDKDLTEYRVDGEEALGTTGFLPHREMSAFIVHVDGKRWKVPDRLWRDCFDPDFDDAADPLPLGRRYVKARLTKDGKRLTVSMTGGDAGGAYTMTWHLREDGRDTRLCEGPL